MKCLTPRAPWPIIAIIPRLEGSLFMHTHRLPRTLLIAITGCLVVLIFSGCGNTRMKDHWQSEDFSKTQLDKVLVVAVTSNQTNRILFEEGLVQTLKNDGITAYASHNAIPKTNPTKEDVIAYVKGHDIKYVLATKVDTIKTNTDYVPESVTTYYTGPYYGYNYYWDDGVTMVREAYTDTQTIVMLVTTVYDAKTEAPVWTGHSETFEMNAVATVGSEIAKTALRNMSR